MTKASQVLSSGMQLPAKKAKKAPAKKAPAKKKAGSEKAS